jgi:cephalosporin hydroxylase
MVQEIIWRTRPNVVIETGIAHGGSVILHASLLRLAQSDQETRSSPMRVIAVDVDIRSHNQRTLEAHPLRSMFTLIEGSSVDERIVARVRREITPDDRVMVVLDSNHTRDHVAAELAAYAPMVSPGCALVLMDGIMPALADLPAGDPGWRSDHPDAALQAFLSTPAGSDFAVDHSFDGYALTHSPGGVLVRYEDSRP